jgi:manganese/zinc/iron transport system substrate-binding protein
MSEPTRRDLLRLWRWRRGAGGGLGAALLVLVAAVVAGCGSGGGDDAAASEIADRKVKVTTTTNFITDTVRQIGGERVEVTGLMGPGVDPHLYKASAGDVGTLREADLIVYGGLQLEGKMADLLEQLEERQTTIAITRDIPRDRLLLPPDDVAEQYDPHVWFDVTNWMYAARTTAATLKEKDPWTTRRCTTATSSGTSQSSPNGRLRRAAHRGDPPASAVLVTSHDAFAYFGRRYGMEVAAIQGISTAAEATTADVQRVAQVLADRRLKAAFIESSVPRQTIDAVLAAARTAEATRASEASCSPTPPEPRELPRAPMWNGPRERRQDRRGTEMSAGPDGRPAPLELRRLTVSYGAGTVAVGHRRRFPARRSVEHRRAQRAPAMSTADAQGPRSASSPVRRRADPRRGTPGPHARETASPTSPAPTADRLGLPDHRREVVEMGPLRADRLDFGRVARSDASARSAECLEARRQ